MKRISKMSIKELNGLNFKKPFKFIEYLGIKIKITKTFFSFYLGNIKISYKKLDTKKVAKILNNNNTKKNNYNLELLAGFLINDLEAIKKEL